MNRHDETKQKRIYRLAPCPSYDVQGIENWLSQMAQEGWMLEEDGILLGVFSFVKNTPQKMRYRLNADQQTPSIWADNSGMPDPEEVEIHKAYNWEYIDRYGDFFIYRSASAQARELHTDPELQAMTLNAVKKRKRSAFLRSCFFIFLYPILLMFPKRISVIHFVLECGTWLALSCMLMILLIIAGQLKELVVLSRYQKNLLCKEKVETEKHGKNKAVLHYAAITAETVFMIAVIAAGVHKWYRSAMGEDQIRLRDYNADVPFATLTDFAGEDVQDYHFTMEEMEVRGYGVNTVEIKEDPLAPVMIEWHEHADITRKDGSVLKGWYEIRYYEMQNEWLAERLVNGIYKEDSRKKNFEEKTAPILSAQDVHAYKAEMPACDKILFRKGNIVAEAEMYFWDENKAMPYEEWTGILADSIGSFKD